VQNWEYTKIALNEVPRRGDDIDLLRDAGEEGWELVAILENNVAYLKREVMASASETAERVSEQTGQRASSEVASVASDASSVKPKYRDPATAATWSGRGRMASWLKRKQEAGEDIGKFLV